MRPIRISYVGGPYDGATEHLDLNRLGLEEYEGFQLPHLTDVFLHVYQCDFWSQVPGEMPDVEVRHVEVRPRPAAVEG